MTKKSLHRFLPSPEKIQQTKFLRLFGRALNKSHLWRFNRHEVARACSIGLFMTFVPVPGHMIAVTALAIVLNANLPIALALAWVVNPFTIIPLYGLAFALGAYIMGSPVPELQFSTSIVGEIWQPFLLGTLLCGTVLAIASNIGVRAYWRYRIIRKWANRRQHRKWLEA